MPLILGTNSIKDTGYDVANSVRFNDDDSPKLSRVPSSAGNTKTGTISLWVKKTEINQNTYLYMVDDGSNQFALRFNNDKIMAFHFNGSSYDFDLQTSALFRDVSSWYHIHLKIDTAYSTAIERFKLYVNNEYIAFNTTISQNFNGVFFKNSTTHLGVDTVNTNHFDGYFAEFVVIDGTALEPTSFGEFDSDSPNIWKPIDVSGLTFGTNGFHLDFENASSLGADVSGNSNNFTVNNLTSIDQSTDTCTNNYATLNSLNMYYPGGTLSEGNLSHSGIPAANYASPFSTIAVSQGKWYVEFKITDVTNWISVGISGTIPDATNDYIGKAPADSWGYIGGSSAGGSNSLYHNSSGSTYGATYANNDIIGLYLDLDNNKLYFAKNGTIQNSGTGISITDPTSLPDGVYYIGAGGFSGSYTHGYQVNYGAGCPFTISSGNSDANGYGNFEYSPNDGGSASFDSSAKNFYALNTKNLAEFG